MVRLDMPATASSGRSVITRRYDQPDPHCDQARFLGSQRPQVFFTAADTAIHSLRGAWTDRQFEKITPRGSVEWRVEALNWVFGA
jgi:hypothetical protein